jgi:hypothetical protein
MLPCMLCSCADRLCMIITSCLFDAHECESYDHTHATTILVMAMQGRDTLRTLTIRQLAKVSASLRMSFVRRLFRLIHKSCLASWAKQK